MEDEIVADSDFDMNSAVDDMAVDLFGETETPEDPGEEIEETPEVPVETVETINEAPSSWKKEMHEAWTSLPPEVQSYINQREEQMREGLDKDRGDASLGRMMRDTMAPYSEMLQQAGVDEPTMVRSMLNAHYRLSTASPTEKVQLFNQLAESYGVSLGEQQEVDPVIRQLQEELNGIKSTLGAKEQAELQAAKERVSKEVEEFASEHPYFDEVSDDLIPFINAGHSLEDAYEKAVWANPVTRQKEQDRVLKEREDTLRGKANERVQTAKKARSANVKSRDTNKAPTGPIGTMEDTMNETLQEIKSRVS